LDHERRAAHLEAIREMDARHIQIALMMQAKAMEALALLDPHDLSPADIVRFIKEGTKLERLARGVGLANSEGEPNHEGHSAVQPTLNQLPAEDPRKILIERLLISVAAQREAHNESLKRVIEIPSTPGQLNGTSRPSAPYSPRPHSDESGVPDRLRKTLDQLPRVNLQSRRDLQKIEKRRIHRSTFEVTDVRPM